MTRPALLPLLCVAAAAAIWWSRCDEPGGAPSPAAAGPPPDSDALRALAASFAPGGAVPLTYRGIAWSHFDLYGRKIAFPEGADVRIAAVLAAAAKAALQTAAAARPVAWDVGANKFVYAGMLAAAGLEVHAFEPQPLCHAGAEAARLINGAEFAARLVPHLAAVGTGGDVLRVSTEFCLAVALVPEPAAGGGVGAREMRIGAADAAKSREMNLVRRPVTAEVPIVSLSELRPGLPPAAPLSALRGRVAVLKIDVEGSEAGVLEDLQPLLAAGVVRQLVVEVASGFWGARGASHARSVRALDAALAASSQAVLLDDAKMDPATVERLEGGIGDVPGPVFRVRDRAGFSFAGAMPEGGPPQYFNLWLTLPWDA